MIELGFDVLLVAVIVLVSWLTLMGAHLLRSIVLFICLGLFVTVAWVRLGGIDVAIAEAAIGAGITGAILLAALRQLQNEPTDHSRGKTDKDGQDVS